MLHNWMKADREREAAGEALGESEREDLARLHRKKAEWESERAELEMEREVLK
ncbi:hypothetical protein GCM10010191_21660 [Actinomadura vinacea]|uniref:Transposase n=1 Tax=Actinomadura vinacea TaxID=115336 RepID=A0ABN3IT75_9ACTN